MIEMQSVPEELVPRPAPLSPPLRNLRVTPLWFAPRIGSSPCLF
jgi:hypothetical protein